MGCLRLRGSARAMDMAKLCHDQAGALEGDTGGCTAPFGRPMLRDLPWEVEGSRSFGVGGICKPVWSNRLPAALEAWLIRNQSRFWSFVEDLMTMVAAVAVNP